MEGTLFVIPFAYPFYPREIIDEQVELSKRLLKKLTPAFADTVFDGHDSKKALKMLRAHDPDLVVALLVSWIEAPHVIDTLRDYFGKPLVLWSHTSFQREGKKQTLGAFVAGGVVKQTLDDFNAPFVFIYGRPGDTGVLLQIERGYRAAKAVKRLKSTRIGLIGYPALGMYTGTVDPIAVKKLLGPEIVHIDQYQLIQKSEAVSESHAKKITGNIKDLAGLGSNVSEENISLSSKMYTALKELVDENQLDAVTVKCQYELSQIYKYTPCVALSLLGNEFPSSCEGDLLTILSQVILYYLTGEAVTYADIHEVLDERVLVASCGFAPFSMSEREDRTIARWGWEAFSGVLNSSPLRKGTVTMARLSRDRGGFKMHVATGKSVGRSEWNEIGCPPFPGTDIVLDGNTKAFAKELVSNHYALVYGDVREELRVMCDFLDVHYIYT